MTNAPAATDQELLVVDLDHTLIHTDLLWEQTFAYLKKNPFFIFQILFWTLKGRLHLKENLAQRVPLSPQTLPYRQSVLEKMRQGRNQGQYVILATASHIRWARPIAEHLALFQECLASDTVNLKGHDKLKALKLKFPHNPFIYIGDSSDDLPLWKASRQAIAVNPASKVVNQLKEAGVDTEIIRDRQWPFKAIVRQMRIHQWVKNILVFIPFLAAHHFLSLWHWKNACLAFVAQSLGSSAIYVINDIIDLDADRLHKTKRFRPLASGTLNIKWSLMLFPTLLILSLTTASFLPSPYRSLLLVYLLLSLAYCLRFKEVVLLDVLILAVLFTLRIFSGGAATSVSVSYWLATFSIFFFFSLALMKRQGELMSKTAEECLPGRGYRPQDLIVILMLGVGSHLISLLIFVLYLNSIEVKALYAHEEMLWILIPLLMYWMARLWILAHRGQVTEDPMSFAFRDRGSWILALIAFTVIILSK